MIHLINTERTIYMNLHVWICFAILTICLNLEIDFAHFWHFAFAFWYLLLTVTAYVIRVGQWCSTLAAAQYCVLWKYTDGEFSNTLMARLRQIK